MVGLVALVAIVGCTTGSQLTVGPLHGHSSVTTHLEWQPLGFYFAEEKTDDAGNIDLCTGSAAGFWSSEICAGWHQCEEMSADLYLNWDQSVD